MGERQNRRGFELARSRAAAGLLLLALTAHAFVASATHFHRLTQPGAFPILTAIQSGEEREQDAPLAGDEKQCLLCRLQRNLISDLQYATLVIAPPTARTHGDHLLHEVAACHGAPLLRQGRAPPSVQS